MKDKKYSDIKWIKSADNVFRPVATCTICKKEYQNNNAFASSYCPICAERIKKEKTAERVRQYRERQRMKKTNSEILI